MLWLLLALTACGGSSGEEEEDDNSVVNVAPVAEAQSVTTMEGTAVAITLVGTDADGDTLTYNITSQPANGNLTGAAPNLIYTPINDSFVGNDSFTFTVNDGTDTSNPATVTIEVAAASPITITTTNLPQGIIGMMYSTTLAASGGSGNYIWSISAGNLPEGLSLSAAGVINGTSVVSGDFELTLNVTDSDNSVNNDSAVFSINISQNTEVGIDVPDWHDDVLPSGPEITALTDGERLMLPSWCQTNWSFPSNDASWAKFYAFPDQPEYGFWVITGSNFDATKPAGMVMYHHGQGGVESNCPYANPWFHGFSGSAESGGLGDQNLVWIKMSYPDYPGNLDYMALAKYALARVMKTYKIIGGWGVNTGFSYGGHMISAFIADTGGWPFNHVAAESAVIQNRFNSNLQPMSYLISVGQREYPWYGLGENAVARLGEIQQYSTARDVYFEVIKNGDHNVSMTENTQRLSRAAYLRSKLFLTPFIYRDDYTESALKNIVDSAQALSMGNAYGHAQQVINNSTDSAVVAKANTLLNAVEARVQAMFDELSNLSISDPVLAEYYADIAVGQLQAHSRYNEFVQLLDGIRGNGEFPTNQSLSARWFVEISERYVLLNVGGGNWCPFVNPTQSDYVNNAVNALPAGSLIARMATETVALGDNEGGFCPPP